jgi:adenylate cyclase
VASEIERKFLVVSEGWRQAAPVRICQGYLNRDIDRTVRVRIAGERAFLTIKGRAKGIARPEFEYQVPVADAEQLLRMCEGPVVEKYRHVLEHAGATWEVDEFLGENAGLVVAEIELESEQQAFEHPDWLGAEVTLDRRYSNSNLSARPYRTWASDPQS